MAYDIIYTKKVIKKDIPNLSLSAKKLIKRAIEECLMSDPFAFGKPLKYALHGQRSLRVSKYRIIYTIDSEKPIVTIIAIEHRKGVYN